jgi:hypothetical protein
VQRSVCKAKRSIFLKPLDKCKDMSVKQRGDFLAALGKVQRHLSQWVVFAYSKRNIGQETKLTLWSKFFFRR